MATTTVHVNCTARPARLAFLIEQPDARVLREVIEINTLLWGGGCNPVLILDGRGRANKGEQQAYSKQPYEEELLLLLRDFDPDFLINYTNSTLPAAFAPFKNRTFLRDSLRWNPWGTKEVGFFMEVWPFVRDFWRQEFRFQKEAKQKFGFIDANQEKDLSAFLVARFGSFPDASGGEKVLERNFQAQAVTYDKEFRESFVPDEWIFPIALSVVNVDVPFPEGLLSHAFFVLNPSDIFDIVDYWNLRATGCRVFPLPIGHYQDFGQGVKRFAAKGTYPINPNVINRPVVIKGRSVEDATHDDVGKWIASLGVQEVVRQGWVPRFGERGYRIAPELKVRQLVAERKSEVVVLSNEHGSLQGAMPDCEMVGDASSQHWATELQVYTLGEEESTFRLPWLRPECDLVANRAVGHGYKLTASRVSKNGIVAIRRATRETLWIQLPKVGDCFSAYLKDSGFTYLRASPPGLALERIIEQLGGLGLCRILQDKGVRQLIQELSNGSPMHAEEARKILWKSSRLPDERRKKVVPAILRRLIAERVLRQGVELQCSRCQRHAWYHLSELSQEFKCKKCFHEQPVPPLDKNPWWYVADGLFLLEGNLEGCLTTVLALLFLNDFLHSESKFLSSFEYRDGERSCERDFALLYSDFSQEDVEVIIGECKTNQPLVEKQKVDTDELGNRTSAYVAFCTLAVDFPDSDKEFFRQQVAAGRKLIILRGPHLEMQYEDVLGYRSKHFYPLNDVELLSRLTVIEVLGKDFAQAHHIWL